MAWTADGKWILEDDSVSTRLTGLLADNNKYIQTARAAGQRTAGRRGLLNTSIAGGAAESAAIAAAAPLASQDSAQTFQRNQAVLEGGISYDNNSRLQQEQITGQKDLNTQQNTHQLAVQQKEAEIQRDRDLLLQEGATEAQIREFDQRSKEQLESISSSERQALLGADTNLRQSQIAANSQLSAQYLQAFSNLASDPNIPADVRNTYIAEFQRVLTQGQALIGVVQSATLDWGTRSTPTPQPTQPVPAPA